MKLELIVLSAAALSNAAAVANNPLRVTSVHCLDGACTTAVLPFEKRDDDKSKGTETSASGAKPSNKAGGAAGAAGDGQISANNGGTVDNSAGDSKWVSPPWFPAPQGGRTQDDDWKDAYQKAREFVSQLTLAEKVNLTTGIASNGVCSGTTGSIPSKNFSGICLQDGPLGIRTTDFNTAFPPGLAAGMTWDNDIIYKRARAIGREFTGKGVDVALGPCVGPLGIKARGGRNWEAFGSDPYLQGIAGALSVQGMQEEGVMANAKHWIANEQESNRNLMSENLNDRALHELYAFPFANLIKAGVGSVMCSYNLVNNSYACENSYVLNKMLKDELGFQGFVVSDWFGTRSGVNSVVSGLDMNMPGTLASGGPTDSSWWGKNLTMAVMNSTVPLDRIDDMAVRIMAAYYKIDLDQTRAKFGPPNFSSLTENDKDFEFHDSKAGPMVTVNKHVEVRSKENYEAAYNTALESVTLLKNNGALPLFNGDKKPRKIALLGKAARPNSRGATCDTIGCLEYPALGYTGNTEGFAQLGYGSGSITMPYLISPYEAIQARCIKENIMFDGNVDSNYTTREFNRTASHSDVNLIFTLAQGGETSDRNDLELFFNATDEILAATKLHKNNVVIISSIGQVNMEKWIDNENVTAVVFAPPGGQDAGQVLADVIVGDYNPSGRLAFTIAKDEKDYNAPIIPADPLKRIQDDEIGKADLFVDYRWFDHNKIEPRFEFGFGLSYSNFSLESIKVDEVKKPDEHLPAPAKLQDPVKAGNLPSVEEVTFPEGFSKVPKFIYPWLDKDDKVSADPKYPFPKEYTTEQRSESTLPGGASGGNPALWDKAYHVSADVKNAGPRDGKFVAQLYIEFPQTDEFVTPRQLRGFEKVEVKCGESQKVEFDILTRDLSVWDVKTASWVVLKGQYKVYVASSSRKLDLEATFDI